MEETNHAIARWLTEAGWSETYVNLAVKAVIILGILVVAYAAAVLFRRLIVPLLQKISARTKAVWDDHLFSDRVMHRAARLIPPLIWYVLLRVAFYDTPVLLNVLHKACLIYLIVAVLQLVAAFLDTLYEISSRHETLRNRPLKGVYQMIKLLAVCVGAILIVSILIGQDATAVLAGLGASAAIIMLIFRDSILGLVAGVQLSANDMLRPGDWITMAKYGADGYVTEVTLTTVKVQNFDKTITTIPPYALVSDSFQNWRGMWDSGGRRIKRSLLIDASSVHNCTAAELADAVDLIRFSEDQFVCWDVLPDDDGVRTLCTPCVYEQYGYRVPVDNSTCVVANALLDLCEATGDRLAFAKAKALADNLTVVQNALDGLIPTSLDVREGAKNRIRGFWVNCTYASILTLLRMAELTGETAGFPADVPRAR